MQSDIEMRPFDSSADLEPILRFVGECNVLTGGCCAMHPGDICHHLSNGLRGRDATNFLYLYEEDGRLLALLVFYPPAAYELIVHPEQRGGALEAALLAWAGARTWMLGRALLATETYVASDVMNCDEVRGELLARQGYAAQGTPYMVSTTRSLLDPIPDAALPAGFSFRDEFTASDVAALAAAHSGAFGSDWSGNAYAAVMHSPAFAYGRELVVVAPDGRFAAFLIYWADSVSKSGLFEPVGCHQDFQRQGLTRALMYEAMRRLRAAGLELAVVKHLADNPASAGLYAAVGFRPLYTLTEYQVPGSVVAPQS